jgi:hypothetical protein
LGIKRQVIFLYNSFVPREMRAEKRAGLLVQCPSLSSCFSKAGMSRQFVAAVLNVKMSIRGKDTHGEANRLILQLLRVVINVPKKYGWRGGGGGQKSIGT